VFFFRRRPGGFPCVPPFLRMLLGVCLDFDNEVTLRVLSPPCFDSLLMIDVPFRNGAAYLLRVVSEVRRWWQADAGDDLRLQLLSRRQIFAFSTLHIFLFYACNFSSTGIGRGDDVENDKKKVSRRSTIRTLSVASRRRAADNIFERNVDIARRCERSSGARSHRLCIPSSLHSGPGH